MNDPAIEAMAQLLTDVPHVMFCVKDGDGRYVAVNQAVADRVGMAAPADVIGLTAGDLFPPELATSYERQDAAIRSTGKPLRNELELILRPVAAVAFARQFRRVVGMSPGAYRSTQRLR